MVVEMFDQCSDLDDFYKKNYTYRNMTGTSEDALNTCDKLTELSNEHDKTLKMMNSATTNTDSSTNSNIKIDDIFANIDVNSIGISGINININAILKNAPGLPIYIIIILSIISTIFIAIPLVPVIISGSLLFVLLTIILVFLTVFAIYTIFK
jgi:hypothetical protein